MKIVECIVCGAEFRGQNSRASLCSQTCRDERKREGNRNYRKNNAEEERERDRHRRKVHPEKERERHRRYRTANPEKKREHTRRWTERNRERLRDNRRLWRKLNPEKVRQKKRRDNRVSSARRQINHDMMNGYLCRYSAVNYEKNRVESTKRRREWVAANPEKAREYQHRYYETNIDAMRERSAQWRMANPEKAREARHRQKESDRMALKIFRALIGPCRKKDAHIARRVLQQLGEQRHDNATS